MAVYSMTGYANASAVLRQRAAAALHEAPRERGRERRRRRRRSRSRSARSTAASSTSRCACPTSCARLEPALREMLTARFKRGKIELRVSGAGERRRRRPRADARAARPPRALDGTRARAPAATRAPLSVHEALHGAAAAAGRRSPSDAGARRRGALRRAACAEARAREGERLAAVLAERVAHLRALADSAEPLVPSAVARSSSASSSAGRRRSTRPARRSPSRARRSRSARSTKRRPTRSASTSPRSWPGCARTSTRSRACSAKGGEIGKRLDFLIQELQREANTLGSKSSSIEMTTISVDMKVAIEQMREQVQNIE